ncbi:MAG: hypothetical protein AMJ88_12040 [Anaerolineae bacterium SM23_ 63]|nr:MAG: hypothetical protein AMJ88_12040 [Anaerolineae bacterium SM23_ 63]
MPFRKLFIAWMLAILGLIPGCTSATPTTTLMLSTVISTPLISTVTPEPTSPPTSTPLPEMILLEPMNYQEQISSSSANTSVAILLGYYNHWVNQEEVDDHLTPIIGGMVWCDFAQYATQYQLMIRPYAPPFRDPIRLLLANHIPVIVGLQVSSGSNDIYFRVFRGYDDVSREFITDDPQQGPETRITYGTFIRLSERGVFIPVYPAEINPLVESLMRTFTMFSEHYCPDQQ